MKGVTKNIKLMWSDGWGRGNVESQWEDDDSSTEDDVICQFNRIFSLSFRPHIMMIQDICFLAMDACLI